MCLAQALLYPESVPAQSNIIIYISCRQKQPVYGPNLAHGQEKGFSPLFQ